MLQVYRLAGEIFEVVHYDLLPIWHEHGDPVVLRILLQASLGLEDLDFDLLEAGKINLIQNLVLNFFEVLLLECYLVRDGLHFLVEVVDLLLVHRHVLYLMS